MSHFRIFMCASALMLIHASATAQDPQAYIFDGAVNTLWTEKGNWDPRYPGMTSKPGEIIIIDADCMALGMDLDIAGGIVVKSSKSLMIRSGELKASGNVVIHGNVIVQKNGGFVNLGITTIESTGRLMNYETVVNESILFVEGAVINKGNWTNTRFGEMHLLSMSTFSNANYFLNEGTLNDYSSGFINNSTLENYGEFKVIGSFINARNLSNLSSMYIEGIWTNSAGSNLFNHRYLNVEVGATLTNSGTTYNFSAGRLINFGNIENSSNGRIFNQGNIETKGGEYFELKQGSYLENQPGSAVLVH